MEARPRVKEVKGSHSKTPTKHTRQQPAPAWTLDAPGRNPSPNAGFGSIPISVPHVRKELGHGPRGRKGCDWPLDCPPIRHGTRDHLARDKTAGGLSTAPSTALHCPRSAHPRNSLLYSTLPRTAPRSPQPSAATLRFLLAELRHQTRRTGRCRWSAASLASAFAFAPALACLCTWLRA